MPPAPAVNGARHYDNVFEATGSPADPLSNNADAYCASTLAPAQEFQVRPGRDTVLVGRQGTVMGIPAGAWERPVGDGVVRVQLREFYSIPDIVLAGLSTASGLNLLETGGMVHLSATAGGQPVALRAGQRMLLRLPTTRKLDGMQLFNGVGTGPHGLDWQLPSGPPAAAALNAARQQVKAFDLMKDSRWPRLPGSDNALLKFFDKRLVIAKATLGRLRRPRTVSPEEKGMLRAYTKANHKKVIRAVRVQLTVDSTGNLRSSVLLPDGDEEIGARLLAAANQLPAWKPARFRRLAAPHRVEKVAAVGILTALYTSSGKCLIGIEWDAEATLLPRIERYAAVLEAQARREGQKQFAARFANAGPLVMDENLYYELEASDLGWINCDRFLEPGPRVQFAVQTAQPNTIVTLVFQQQRSILASTRTEGTAAVFVDVPAGASATVVAIRREKGVTLLATTPATVGQINQPVLDFKPVSLEELRTTLAAL